MTTLWECIWRTAAVTFAVWLMSMVLRRQSAALRHWLWVCALVSYLIVPALIPLAHRTPPIRMTVAVPMALEVAPAIAPAAGGHAPTRPETVRLDWLLPAIWIAGSALFSWRRIRVAWRMKRIAGRSTQIAHATRISGEIKTPLTWGFIHPVILLPRAALEWTPARLTAVLEHEREHIRRFDSLWHWLSETVCVVWWFHPLAWLARGRAAHERECACDDAVLRSGVRPSDYATELVNLASTLSQGEPVMALSALSNFERRVRQLLVPDVDRRAANLKTSLLVVLAAIAVIAPFALLRAQPPAGQGDLSGTVLDPSGARIVNAQVIASGSSGNREVTRTDAAGRWSFAGIPSGDYHIEIRARGFVMGAQDVKLAPGQRASVENSLELGKVQEMIEVVGKGQPRSTPATTESGRIRVGGNVQMTKLIKQPKLVYPESAKARGIEGAVLLNAIIGKDGELLSVAVVNKLADPDLAAAALDAVKQWRYQPTLLNGEPVEVVTTITVNFRLEE